MPAWIEDAQILTAIKDLNQSQRSLLKRTSDVDDFLFDHSLASSALVAPKGFGKTFVLKLKRISLQKLAINCLPHDLIVDRPKDQPPVFSQEILDLLALSENWETLWQIAIATALLKGHRTDDEAQSLLQEIQLKVSGNKTLEEIITTKNIDKPFEVIHSCLCANRGDFFDILGKSQFFTAAYSRYNKPAAIFIDNIDEYLERYSKMANSRKDYTHKLYLKIWHNGQIGAWSAIRRMHGINPHVKNYISLRKEAFHYASAKETTFSNLKSFAVELRYSMSDIEDIIEKNIANESPSKISDRHAGSAIERFLGPKNIQIPNSGTGKHELVLDYWLRHCTGRPRDAVEIGKGISNIAVEDRTISSIRTAINNAASERVQSLFVEVAPFFDGFFPDILPMIIKSNVLSRQEIEDASEDYRDAIAEKHGYSSDNSVHIFCALYTIGLVGVVTNDRDNVGTLTQKFSTVGQAPFGTVGILPYAETYLVHPSLSDYIVGRNVTFLKKLNRHNIVGNGLEWRAEEELKFVAVGDMRSYREKIMQDVSGSQTFEKYWKSVFAQHTRGLDFAEISNGDSVILVDRSPMRLLRAIRGLSATLSNSRYAMKMRFGGHSGHWRLNQNADGDTHPEISEIVSVAARLEPLAKTGAFLFTTTFWNDAHRIGTDLKREGARNAIAGDFTDGRFDPTHGLLFSKPGREKENWVHCFIIEDADSSI